MVAIFAIFGIVGGSALAACLLYTSDAADDLLCVDLGGRRIIKKKKKHNITTQSIINYALHKYTNLTDIAKLHSIVYSHS